MIMKSVALKVAGTASGLRSRWFSRVSLHLSYLLFLSLSLSLLITACNNGNKGDDDNYDPRNVTRIDNHLEVQPELVVDSRGNVHLVYFGGPSYYEPLDVFYIRQNDDEEWSEPVNLSNSSNNSIAPQVAIDYQDRLHVIWEEDGEGNGRTMYTMKEPNEDWTDPVYITGEYNLSPQIGIDEYGTIHVAGDGFRLQYLQNIDGVWMPMENPDTISILNPNMVVSENGDVFIAAESGDMIELVTRYKETGQWKREFITDSYAYPWVGSVAVDPSGTVYVAWTVKYTDQIKIRMKYPDGTWSEIDSIPDMEGDPWRSQIVVDEEGHHVVWNAYTEAWDYDIYLQTRTHDGLWLERQQLSLTTSASLDQGIFLKDNVLYTAWHEKYDRTKNSNRDIYYVKITISN